MLRFAQCLLVVSVVLGMLAGPSQAARLAPANSITVTSLLDPASPGNCGLRDAILAANTNTATGNCPAGDPGLDTINFPIFFCPIGGCVIHLAGPLPTVTQDLTINGRGILISGEALYVVFNLGSVVVNLSNLGVVNGRGNFGGGIIMGGTTLTLNNVVVSGNGAQSGGGLYQPSGTLHVFNSRFIDNFGANNGFGGAIGQAGGTAVITGTLFSGNFAGSGGAAASLSSSILDVTASVFDNNSAAIWGGAVYLQDQPVQASIAGSTFTGNQALSSNVGYGGGAIFSNRSTLTLTSSTLANNTSNGRAGALNIFGGPVTLTNVTLSSNTAQDSGGGLFVQSDGINDPATVTLNNVTITDNTADSDDNNTGNGGGIFKLDGTVTVLNSIIAGNFDTPNNDGAGTLHPDCSGIFVSPNYNLVGRNTGCVGFVNGVNGNLAGSSGSPLDPRLAPLADNGGPTLTHALLGDSPALNAANPLTPGSGGSACAGTDQRGLHRPFGARCDLGAFEAAFLLYAPFIQR